METIVTLKSNTGDVKLPRTLASAVSLINGTDVQSKISEIDNTLANHNHNNDYYLKQEVEDFVNNRLSQLDISTLYTRLEMDQLLASKANITHNHDDVYFKITDFNTRLEEALSQGTSGLFLTRIDAEKMYSNIDHKHDNDYYTKEQVDALIAAITNNNNNE